MERIAEPSTPQRVVERWSKIYGITDGNTKRYALKYLEEKQKRMAAEGESRVDYLTGLWNRRGGFPQIRKLMGFSADEVNQKVASNKEHKEVTLFAIDANNLSRANNRYGHDVGDAYIQAVADTLRNEGIALRVGGDEFLLARAFKGHDDVIETRKRIHDALQKNFNARLLDVYAKQDDARAKKGVEKAMKDAAKGRFSLAIGSVSVVKQENMPEKPGLFTGKRVMRAVSRYIPNFLNLKPQEGSELFHHTVSMEDYLDRNRKKTTAEYMDSLMRDADLLGYLHKYTRKRKTSSAFLVKIDEVRKK